MAEHQGILNVHNEEENTHHRTFAHYHHTHRSHLAATAVGHVICSCQSTSQL